MSNSQVLVGQRETHGESREEGDATVENIRGKQREYAVQVSEMLKAIQKEADSIIKLPTKALGPACTAAYLASDAVVIMFDISRNMTSRPLRDLTADAVVSIAEAGTPELLRKIADKKRLEVDRLNSLKGMADELDAILTSDATVRETLTQFEHSGIGLPAGQSFKEDIESRTGDGDESLSDVDKTILKAVDKGLDVLGQKGREAILGLLEARYGLRIRDVPQHPRNFIEILNELIGSAGLVIEKEIINELSKSYSIQGKTLDQVVRSLESRSVATAKAEKTDPVGATEQALENTPEDKRVEVPSPPVVASPADGRTAPSSASPETKPQPSDGESTKPDELTSPYKLSFTVEAPFIPIGQFLQGSEEPEGPGSIAKSRLLSVT